MPPKFDPAYKERTIWTLMIPEGKKDWNPSDKGTTVDMPGDDNGAKIELHQAPTCFGCTGEDHHYATCEWANLYGAKSNWKIRT